MDDADVPRAPGTREIRAKTLLARNKDPEGWFGCDYTLNIYRGCDHGCIYCDSRSDCYRIVDFDTVQVKVNALEVLARELARKQPGSVIGTGAMSDPYAGPERDYNLTGRALELIRARGLGIHICTKSDLVVRDLAVLKRLAQVRASVALTVTTPDETRARLVEPRAPSPDLRFAALQQLAAAGIFTGVALMPVLPFIQDTAEDLVAIAERTAAAGGRFVIAWLGMSLRDGQREHYYGQLDRHFPELRARYEAEYGSRHRCAVPDAATLGSTLEAACRRLGLMTRMSEVVAATRGRHAEQMRLF